MSGRPLRGLAGRPASLGESPVLLFHAGGGGKVFAASAAFYRVCCVTQLWPAGDIIPNCLQHYVESRAPCQLPGPLASPNKVSPN